MSTADLEAIPLFAALTPEERARVATVTRLAQFEVGHVVVNEGEFAFDFYAIKRGAAKVRRGGEHIADLGPGDVFGELGVVPDETRHWTRRRAASVIVTAPIEVVVIDGGDFRRLVEAMPALSDAIRALAAKRDSTHAA